MPSRWGECGPTTGRRLIRSHRAHPHSNPQAAAQRAADGISSGAYGEVRTQPTERVDDGVRERCSQRRSPITSRITCRAGEHPGERTRSSRHLGAICGAPACSCTRPSEARSPRPQGSVLWALHARGIRRRRTRLHPGGLHPGPARNFCHMPPHGARDDPGRAPDATASAEAVERRGRGRALVAAWRN